MSERAKRSERALKKTRIQQYVEQKAHKKRQLAERFKAETLLEVERQRQQQQLHELEEAQRLYDEKLALQEMQAIKLREDAENLRRAQSRAKALAEAGE